MKKILNNRLTLNNRVKLTLLSSLVLFTGCSPREEIHHPQETLPLIPNIWQKVTPTNNTPWQRVRHGGAAFDSKRQKVYFFGSDTHDTTPYDLDNSIHEFDLMTKHWLTHYKPAPIYTYRTDREGYAVAGLTEIQPWAMHTFDNILYDPVTDAIIVTAKPRHNHQANQAVPAVKQHPTWLYDLKTKKWRIIKNKSDSNPTFFAAASAYDSTRELVVAYDKTGIWELNTNTETWMQASQQRHHEIHFSMTYDDVNQLFAIFGNYRGSKNIWIYKPKPLLLKGTSGEWEKRTPKGKNLPASEHYPVAYDSKSGIFLLVINEPTGNRANTYIYDAMSNQLHQLPLATIEAVEMNYNMIYSKQLDAFYLFTGSDKKKLGIWKLKLKTTKHL